MLSLRKQSIASKSYKSLSPRNATQSPLTPLVCSLSEASSVADRTRSFPMLRGKFPKSVNLVNTWKSLLYTRLPASNSVTLEKHRAAFETRREFRRSPCPISNHDTYVRAHDSLLALVRILFRRMTRWSSEWLASYQRIDW